MQSDRLPAQPLLVPIAVQVAVADADEAESHAELFASLGLDVDRSGPAQLLVRSTPALLPNIDPATLLKDMIADLREQGQRPRRRRHSTGRSAPWPATRPCAPTAG